jgi:c-di-AMP phosphodiesterase-like protein
MEFKSKQHAAITLAVIVTLIISSTIIVSVIFLEWWTLLMIPIIYVFEKTHSLAMSEFKRDEEKEIEKMIKDEIKKVEDEMSESKV